MKSSIKVLFTIVAYLHNAVKEFLNLFVFTRGIENIGLFLKSYLSLSLHARSRPASLSWPSLYAICVNRVLHNSSRL